MTPCSDPKYCHLTEGYSSEMAFISFKIVLSRCIGFFGAVPAIFKHILLRFTLERNLTSYFSVDLSNLQHSGKGSSVVP